MSVLALHIVYNENQHSSLFFNAFYFRVKTGHQNYPQCNLTANMVVGNVASKCYLTADMKSRHVSIKLSSF